MSRTNLTPEFLAKLQEAHVQGFWMMDVYLDSATLHLTTLPFATQWFGLTYQGLGGIASFEAIAETASGARGLKFTLPLVSQAAIAAALTEPVQGRKVVMLYAVIDGTELRVDPGVWKGTLDTRRLNGLYGPTPEYVVTAEHVLRAWDVPRMPRYSDADHRRRFPDDGFFKHADKIGTDAWPARSWFEAHK